MSKNTKPSYGSTTTATAADTTDIGKDEQNSRSFKESDLLYVRDNALSPNEKRMKVIKITIPIIIAILLIGGLALFLLRDWWIGIVLTTWIWSFISWTGWWIKISTLQQF